MPLLHVTTHLDDSPDPDLLSEKGHGGFPTLSFMEPETGAVLNAGWWPSDAETIQKHHDDAKGKAGELTALLRKAEANKEDMALQAAVQIKLALMYAAQVSMEELGKLAATEGLDPKVKQEFDLWYAGRRVTSALDEAFGGEGSRAEKTERAQKAMYLLLKDGTALAPDHQLAQTLYSWGLDGAVAAGDKKVAQTAFEGLEESLGLVMKEKPEYESRIKDMIAEAKEKVDSIGAE